MSDAKHEEAIEWIGKMITRLNNSAKLEETQLCKEFQKVHKKGYEKDIEIASYILDCVIAHAQASDLKVRY